MARGPLLLAELSKGTRAAHVGVVPLVCFIQLAGVLPLLFSEAECLPPGLSQRSGASVFPIEPQAEI